MNDIRVEVDKESLSRLLTGFKALPKEVQRGVRKELRTVGDGVIAGQRAILAGPLPAGVQVTGQKRTLKTSKGGSLYVHKRNTYGDRDRSGRARSTGLRDAISAGLVTRVVTGKTRQGIEVKTRNAKAPMSRGWNSKMFRHPVFGRKDEWVYQRGQPYFFAPAIAGRDDMIIRATQILNKALEDA
ncbi:MAG: hypothetical protein LBG60_15010 [Bifidobacteriaceae bacterium]|nr:hypothetical protein [Bifidobacteriaceae bacterium]